MRRRQFLKTTGGAAALSVAPFARVLGANDDVRVAVVGVGSTIKIGGRGKSHIKDFSAVPGTRVVAICDPDLDILDGQARKLADAGRKVKTYRDIRKLLEDKEIDAISVATPNHWHALATVWGCQAGKDVYVEKPVSHNLWEGRKMVEAARKHDRIVHTGLAARSSEGLREAVQYVQEGNLGKIRVARGVNYRRRKSIGKVAGPQPIPASVDYDLWSGPAPTAPLMREFLHYDWHWVWPTGNGDIGNMGVHMMDTCRWVLGQDSLAPRVLSVGGRFGYVDDGETPNTHIITFDYDPAPLVFEIKGLAEEAGSEARPTYKGIAVGIVIECEDGYLTGEGNGSQNPTAYDNDGKVIKKFEGPGGNYAHFIDAVRSRKSSDMATGILDGHLSTALCHMGNISYRVGKTMPPGEIREALEDDKDALDAFDRMRGHLDKNEVDLEKTPAALGSVLDMDSAAERFTGGRGRRRANKLLAREYRKPYVINEEV